MNLNISCFAAILTGGVENNRSERLLCHRLVKEMNLEFFLLKI